MPPLHTGPLLLALPVTEQLGDHLYILLVEGELLNELVNVVEDGVGEAPMPGNVW